MFSPFPLEVHDVNHANPRADHKCQALFREDLETLSTSEGGQRFCSIYDGDMGKLMHDDETREEFIRIDLKEIRARQVTAAIPPPGEAPAAASAREP